MIKCAKLLGLHQCQGGVNLAEGRTIQCLIRELLRTLSMILLLPQDKPDWNNRFILLFNEYVPGGKFVSRAPHIWAWLDLLTLILQN